MGTDIFFVFQRDDGGRWVEVETEYTGNRRYKFFEALDEIAPARGLPDAFVFRKSSWHPGLLGPGRAPPVTGERDESESDVPTPWLDYSWATGEELLAWAVFECVLTRAEYETSGAAEWDPRWDADWDAHWYRSVTGHDVVLEVKGDGVVLVDRDDAQALARDDWTHVRCRFRKAAATEFAYFFDEVARLVALHGRIRMVFGFD